MGDSRGRMVKAWQNKYVLMSFLGDTKSQTRKNQESTYYLLGSMELGIRW